MRASVFSKIALRIGVFFLAATASASHGDAGGYIYYESLAQKPGYGSLDYAVHVELYVDSATVISGPPALFGCVQSSCTADQTLHYRALTPPPSLADPVYPQFWKLTPSSQQCGAVPPRRWMLRYNDTVQLGGKCADFRFSVGRQGGRRSVDNVPPAVSAPFYLEAGLNNVVEPHSSAIITNSGSAAYCIDTLNAQRVSWPQMVTNTDKDSLVFMADPSGILTASNSCGIDSVVDLKPPYNTAQYFPSATPIRFRRKVRRLEFSPQKPGLYLFKIRVREIRIDTTCCFYNAGFSTKEVVLFFTNKNCRPAGSNIALTEILDTANIHCRDSLIRLPLHTPLNPSTLASDGTDFSITDSQGNKVLVTKAALTQNRTMIELTLGQTLPASAQLTLINRVGLDGNTLSTFCYGTRAFSDTLHFTLQGCPGAPPVSLPARAKVENLQMYPNPVRNMVRWKKHSAEPPRRVVVYDLFGKRLKEASPSALRRHQMDLHEFKAGVYMVRFEFSGNTILRKILKN